VECDFENAIACSHREDKNNKMSREIYKAVEAETRKVRIKRGREKGKRRKEEEIERIKS